MHRSTEKGDRAVGLAIYQKKKRKNANTVRFASSSSLLSIDGAGQEAVPASASSSSEEDDPAVSFKRRKPTGQSTSLSATEAEVSSLSGPEAEAKALLSILATEAKVEAVASPLLSSSPPTSLQDRLSQLAMPVATTTKLEQLAARAAQLLKPDGDIPADSLAWISKLVSDVEGAIQRNRECKNVTDVGELLASTQKLVEIAQESDLTKVAAVLESLQTKKLPLTENVAGVLNERNNLLRMLGQTVASFAAYVHRNRTVADVSLDRIVDVIRLDLSCVHCGGPLPPGQAGLFCSFHASE